MVCTRFETGIATKYHGRSARGQLDPNASSPCASIPPGRVIEYPSNFPMLLPVVDSWRVTDKPHLTPASVGCCSRARVCLTAARKTQRFVDPAAFYQDQSADSAHSNSVCVPFTARAVDFPIMRSICIALALLVCPFVHVQDGQHPIITSHDVVDGPSGGAMLCSSPYLTCSE